MGHTKIHVSDIQEVGTDPGDIVILEDDGAGGGMLPAVDGSQLTNISAPSGSDANYVHTQNVPSAVWTVTHGLGKRPSVVVVDSGGTQVEGEVTYVNDNIVVIVFTAAFGGSAYFN